MFLLHSRYCFQEGIELLQTSMVGKQERYGDHSAQVAETLKLIGSSYLSLGDIEKALEALKKVSYKIYIQ